MADTFNAESDSPQTVVANIAIRVEEPLRDSEDGAYDEETGAAYSSLWTLRSWQSDSGSSTSGSPAISFQSYSPFFQGHQDYVDEESNIPPLHLNAATDSWNHMLPQLSISSRYPSYPNSTPSSPRSPQRLQLPPDFHSESPFEQPPHRYPSLLEVPHRHHHSRPADDNHSIYSDDSSDSVYFSSGEDFSDEAQDIHPVIQSTTPIASSSHEEIGITSYGEALDVPIAGPQHLHGHPKSWDQWNAQPAPVSSQPQFMAHKTPSGRSHGVITVDDMMSLLADSGGPITSQDPSIIRQQFIYRLSLSGNLGSESKNFFRKPTKAKVSSMAGLRASSSRRKVDAAFFCELDYCKAGFTRKNGLLNHYRAHLGIADKECKFCHMFFTTSLGRHEKKCKSNPCNEKHSPTKIVAS